MVVAQDSKILRANRFESIASWLNRFETGHFDHWTFNVFSINDSSRKLLFYGRAYDT
jgi:hypothetical protein